MEDELKALNQEYDELVKEINDLEELKAHCEGDPGAYSDLVRDLDDAYESLERVTREIEALVVQKRKEGA